MSEEMNADSAITTESAASLHEIPPSDPPAPPTDEEVNKLLDLIQKDPRPYVRMMRDGIDPWDAIVATKRVETLEEDHRDAVRKLDSVVGPMLKIEEKFESLRVAVGMKGGEGDPSAILDAAVAAVNRLKVVETELNTAQPPSAVTGVDANALEDACRRIAEQTHGVNPKRMKSGRVYEVTVPEADASLLRIATGVATT